MKRRDFMKLLGGSACGLVMASCGVGGSSGGGAGGDVSLPNGYEYYRLFSTGKTLPNGAEAQFFPGSAKINDLGEIIFHAGDRAGVTGAGLAMGVYELQMEFSTASPLVAGFRQVVRQGDLLSGNRKVAAVGLAGSNHQGTIACKLRVDGDSTESIHMERQTGEIEPVIEYLTPLPGTDGGRFGASLGNFDVGHNDDMLVSAHYFTDGAEDSGEGLFHVPDGTVSDSGGLLLRAGEQVPDTTHVISRLGLFDGQTDDDDYVAQVHTVSGLNTSADTRSDSDIASLVVKGNTRSTGTDGLKRLTASKGTGTRATAISGNTIYAPRVGDNGSTATVIHTSANDMALVYNESVLLSTGDRTPTGGTIYSFGGPIVGPDGILYCVAFTDEGSAEELLVSNGAQIRSVLSSGESFGGTGGPKLISIAFGHSRDQVDGQGRIVMIGEFDNQTLSIMVGIPV